MTPAQKMLGIAALALVIAGGMGVAVKATRSPFAVTRFASTSSQPCAEGSFAWRWNVPGSACEARADAN
jgi:hypothetical protein